MATSNSISNSDPASCHEGVISVVIMMSTCTSDEMGRIGSTCSSSLNYVVFNISSSESYDGMHNCIQMPSHTVSVATLIASFWLNFNPPRGSVKSLPVTVLSDGYSILDQAFDNQNIAVIRFTKRSQH